MALRIAVSSDHGGLELKNTLVEFLRTIGFEVIDMGVHSSAPCDYPDQARALAETVALGEVDRGILVCGTGIGMSIAANKRQGVRAALCTDATMARLSREHNDANILCLGARVIGVALAKDIVMSFLEVEFLGGRHARRVDKLESP
jgi:ribose 5-phosphate isomerase B